MMLEASSHLDSLGFNKYAFDLDDMAGDLLSEEPSVETGKTLNKQQAKRKVMKGLNAAHDKVSGVFFKDDGWKGISDFIDVLRNYVDDVYIMDTEYLKHKSRGDDRDQKRYIFRAEKGGFKFDFDLVGSEEGDFGHYQVWFLNLRNAS